MLGTAAVLAGLERCPPLNGAYEELHLDPSSLSLRVSGHKGVVSDLERGYVWFRFSHDVLGAEVADCEEYEPGKPRVCHNIFTVDREHRLLYRTKFLELWRGPFGAVYDQVVYDYQPDYVVPQRATPVRRPNRLHTFLAQQRRHVPPHVEGTPPADGAALPPSAISAVRVWQTSTRVAIASANYSRDGRLSHATVETASQLPGDTLAGAHGLPTAFPIASYLAGQTGVFGAPPTGHVGDAVFLHHDESYRVRRDLYLPGQPVATTYLRFRQTKEDSLLRALDRTRVFATP